MRDFAGRRRPSTRRSMTALLDASLATGHTFVLALLPLLTVAASAAMASGARQPRPVAILVILLSTAGALVATRVFGGSLHARATWLSAALILLGGYSTVLSHIRT